jgi:hypothetical protein
MQSVSGVVGALQALRTSTSVAAPARYANRWRSAVQVVGVDAAANIAAARCMRMPVIWTRLSDRRAGRIVRR